MKLITKGLTKNMFGLEIGASHNPLCPKKDGWNVKTLDYASTEELKKICSLNPKIDINKIESVDFVLQKSDFLNTVQGYGDFKFDFIIYSHAIEHTTCFISYLNMLENLLSDNCQGILVVPNKFCCFDFFKPLTNSADIVDNYNNKISKHSDRKILQMLLNNVNNNNEDGWDSYQSIGHYSFQHQLSEIRQTFRNLIKANNEKYVDIHEWYFIPSTFELIMFELYFLGYTKIKIRDIVEKTKNEFIVYLYKEEKDIDITQHEIELKRKNLSAKVIKEQKYVYKKVLYPNLVSNIKNRLKKSLITTINNYLNRADNEIKTGVK